MSCSCTQSPIYQCIPNFSEGRRPETVAAFVHAADGIAGVRVIDWSMDVNHNRSVITLLGEAQPIHDAVLAMAEVALLNIDVRTHSGIHPRTGAIDVVPVVPIRNASHAGADLLAHHIGESLANALFIPVYYYEWSAPPNCPRKLPDIRRFLVPTPFATVNELNGGLAPDVGPSDPHTTAGVSVVGARGPLAAYNINLRSSDNRISRAIAKSIRIARSSESFLEGVRALGLHLPTKDSAQVSMNVTMPDITPLPAIWDYVSRQASMLGTAAIESEVIGVIRSSWLAGASPTDILWTDFSANQLLETWLDNATASNIDSCPLTIDPKP